MKSPGRRSRGPKGEVTEQDDARASGEMRRRVPSGQGRTQQPPASCSIPRMPSPKADSPHLAQVRRRQLSWPPGQSGALVRSGCTPELPTAPGSSVPRWVLGEARGCTSAAQTQVGWEHLPEKPAPESPPGGGGTKSLCPRLGSAQAAAARLPGAEAHTWPHVLLPAQSLSLGPLRPLALAQPSWLGPRALCQPARPPPLMLLRPLQDQPRLSAASLPSQPAPGGPLGGGPAWPGAGRRGPVPRGVPLPPGQPPSSTLPLQLSWTGSD